MIGNRKVSLIYLVSVKSQANKKSTGLNYQNLAFPTFFKMLIMLLLAKTCNSGSMLQITNVCIRISLMVRRKASDDGQIRNHTYTSHKRPMSACHDCSLLSYKVILSPPHSRCQGQYFTGLLYWYEMVQK